MKLTRASGEAAILVNMRLTRGCGRGGQTVEYQTDQRLPCIKTAFVDCPVFAGTEALLCGGCLFSSSLEKPLPTYIQWLDADVILGHRL